MAVVTSETTTVYRYGNRRSLTKATAYRRAAADLAMFFAGCSGYRMDDWHDYADDGSGDMECQFHRMFDPERGRVLRTIARLLQEGDAP